MRKSPARGHRRVLTVALSAIALTALAVPATAVAVGGIDLPGGAARQPGDQTQSVKQAIHGGSAKNVILLIGDGMGDSEITIARNYAYGAAGALPGIDALPLTGSYTTYSLYKDGTPYAGKPDYVPDSAATGTAWATGTKTYDNAVGVDIHGAAHDNLIEIAKANGFKTGNVSTAEIQDATPAVMGAHVAARSCYAPDSVNCGADALQNGGLGSISEQLLDTRADVTLGGGSLSFDKAALAGPWAGKTLFQQASQRGYQVVKDAAGLSAVTAADQSKPVLGIFTPGNFPTRFAPSPATVGGADLPPVTCTAAADRLPTELSLASLTTKAISLLNTSSSKKGFFLQVEGASIDKQDHGANACGQIGETIDLDEAVQAALAFAKQDGNTLVIVTADHAHTSQIVDSVTPGLSVAVTTADGVPMKIAYGTAPLGGSQQHTGSQLRIAAFGPGAANVVGLTDQTDTFFTIADTLKLNRDVDSLSAKGKFRALDKKVRPGETVVLGVSDFFGDRQITGVVEGTSFGVGKTDLVNGSAEFRIVAPKAPGTYTLTVTGSQTGKTASLTVKIRK